METYDRIVLGLGGIGSAALHALSARGLRVLGLEQFGIAHNRGSSHGQTRIIRQAYFEHPDYVPLLRDAYCAWDHLEMESGQKLFERVGLLEMGPPNGLIVPAIEKSASLYGLSIERLTASECNNRFQGLRVPDMMSVVFEKNAGYLYVERCVQIAIELAQQRGAVTRVHEAIQEVRLHSRYADVITDRNSYQTQGLVICLGAWSPAFLPISLPLKVVRKHLHWFANIDPTLDVRNGCPPFFYEMPNGYFYGFPALDERGVKVAEHTGGELVADPTNLDRSLDRVDADRVEQFTRACLPSLSEHRTHHAVCMYTLTPDEHFIVDLHPDHPTVAIAAGFSGHGFKFAAGLGKILAEMSISGQKVPEIEFLAASRFQQTT